MKRFLIVSLFCCVSALGVFAQSSYTPIKVESKHETKHKKWVARDTRILDNIHEYKQIKQFKNTNRYGSNCNVRYDSTGFYHTVLDGERWWIVDPEGYRHFNMAVVCVKKGSGKTNKEAFSSKFHDNNELWMQKTAKLLHSLKFNGSGAWSAYDQIREYNDTHSNGKQLSYTPLLSFMSKYDRNVASARRVEKGRKVYRRPSVFDKAFAEFCDKLAEREIQKYKNDPNLLGYFSDNELPIDNRCLEAYLELPEENEGRKAAEAWLAERNIKREDITKSVKNEFAGYVAEVYYSTVSAAIRRYDPNHMYLGSRLHGKPKSIKEVIEAAGRHCDIVSINYYSSWTPAKKYMQNLEKWSGKPFIVTEFYTKAMDSGLSNATGAGMVVKTQKDRGHAYQHFTLGLLESGNCVGWQWFRYQDNDPTNKKADPSNRDSNKGIVDNNYKPYKELVKAMRQVNSNVYPLAEFFDKKRAKQVE